MNPSSVLCKFRESGWYSGKKLDFHPSNPGSTPAWVNYHKKDQTQLVCLNNDRVSQGVLKKIITPLVLYLVSSIIRNKRKQSWQLLWLLSWNNFFSFFVAAKDQRLPEVKGLIPDPQISTQMPCSLCHMATPLVSIKKAFLAPTFHKITSGSYHFSAVYEWHSCDFLYLYFSQLHQIQQHVIKPFKSLWAKGIYPWVSDELTKCD